MRSEKSKMLAGELYDPLDAELVEARERARDLCQDLNATRERDVSTRQFVKTCDSRPDESACFFAGRLTRLAACRPWLAR